MSDQAPEREPIATVTPMSEHPSGRPAASAKRRRIPMRARVALGGVLVFALGWVVLASPILSVRQVAVAGAEGAAADAVIAAAQAPIGEPIARVDTTLVASRVMALPWVDTVEIRRGYPSTLVIAVTERVPVARVDDSYLDADGMEFVPTGVKPKGLPEVTATGVGREAAARVIASLPASLAPRVVSATASTRDDVELTLRSGSVVLWGSAEDPELKASVLEALLTRRAERYDVSAPELPTTTGERPRD